MWTLQKKCLRLRPSFLNSLTHHHTGDPRSDVFVERHGETIAIVRGHHACPVKGKRDCYPTFRLGFCGGVMRPDERSF
jgi:hypothetical protein